MKAGNVSNEVLHLSKMLLSIQEMLGKHFRVFCRHSQEMVVKMFLKVSELFTNISECSVKKCLPKKFQKKFDISELFGNISGCFGKTFQKCSKTNHSVPNECQKCSE